MPGCLCRSKFDSLQAHRNEVTDSQHLNPMRRPPSSALGISQNPSERLAGGCRPVRQFPRLLARKIMIEAVQIGGEPLDKSACIGSGVKRHGRAPRRRRSVIPVGVEPRTSLPTWSRASSHSLSPGPVSPRYTQRRFDKAASIAVALTKTAELKGLLGIRFTSYTRLSRSVIILGTR
jgi:hypothetical protein